MQKLQVGGVEEVALKLERGFMVGAAQDVRGAVEEVADDGVAERLQVDADLVGAAGFDLDFGKGEGAVGCGEALEGVDVGDGGAAVGAAGRHAGAANEVAGDGQRDRGVVLGEVAVGEGEVGLVDLAGGEHLAQPAVREVVLGDDDGARSLLVQAVDDAGAEVAANLGQAAGHVEEERVDQGSGIAVLLTRAGAGVDHHAGRFVDDGEELVLKEDFKRYVLRCGVEGFGVGLAFNLDGFPALEPGFGLWYGAVDADLAGVDEELDAGSGDVRQGLGEVLVEPQAGGSGIGGEGADGRGLGFVVKLEHRD